MKSWADFWNTDTPIYANERHKLLHYRLIARDIAALIPSPDAHVLDYGCGEALSAGELARRCGRLTLCDAAPLVRERLSARFGGNPRIAIAAPEEITAGPDASFDLIVANSLIQYLTRAGLVALLAVLRAKLAPQGTLVVADVIPPDLGPARDAAALLAFAARGGFFMAACGGLVRTALSDYRKLRSQLGLARYGEDEMVGLIAEAGFTAHRHRPNIGHNQARMAFLARPS